jgi:hypothetical protein
MILGVQSSDLDSLELNLGKSFFEEKGLPGSFNRDVFVSTWKKLIEANVGALWVIKDEGKVVGALGGTIYPDPNDGELVAQEAFWYVDHERRHGVEPIRLFLNFEAWAKTIGAKRLIMVALINSDVRIGKLYEARGYKAVETIYLKNV